MLTVISRLVSTKVLSRRNQLQMRNDRKEAKGKGKGKGRGKNKDTENQKKPGKKKPDEETNGNDDEECKKPVKRTRKRKAATESESVEPEVGESKDGAGSSKDTKKTEKTEKTKKTAAKSKAKAKSSSPKPKASPKKKGRNSKGAAAKKASSPSASASPAELEGAAAEPEDSKPTRRRKVATPQNQSPPSGQILGDLLKQFKGEIAHQWKGKGFLGRDDFPHLKLSHVGLSCYFTRSRPAIGVVAKKKHYPMKTNLEFANYSFNLIDVHNVGLAHRCAVVTVSRLILWTHVFKLWSHYGTIE